VKKHNFSNNGYILGENKSVLTFTFQRLEYVHIYMYRIVTIHVFYSAGK